MVNFPHAQVQDRDEEQEHKLITMDRHKHPNNAKPTWSLQRSTRRSLESQRVRCRQLRRRTRRRRFQRDGWVRTSQDFISGLCSTNVQTGRGQCWQICEIVLLGFVVFGGLIFELLQRLFFWYVWFYPGEGTYVLDQVYLTLSLQRRWWCRFEVDERGHMIFEERRLREQSRRRRAQHTTVLYP